MQKRGQNRSFSLYNLSSKNRRGLSTIVITLIIILVSLVAVGIIWVVVRNVIQTGAEGIAMGQFTLDAKIMNVNLENSSNNVNLTVKRNPGEGEFTSLKFIFYDGKDSEVITEQVSLSQLEERRFNFHLNLLNVSRLVSISIVPILNKNGKDTIGNVLDKYTVGSSEQIVLPVGSCTPATCSALGYVCGTWANGTCAGTLNCGTCGSGYSCVGGTCQLSTSVYRNNISQYGITWYFDKEYESGTFANGDYWVVGPVIITTINPMPLSNRNGTNINPMPSYYTAFDNRDNQFNQTKYNEVAQHLPLIVQQSSSVVTALSNPDTTQCVDDSGSNAWYNYKGQCVWGYIKVAAVLTVLSAVPPDNGATVFRPAYTGTTKTLYSTNNIQWNLLLNLTTSPNPPNITEVIDTLARVRLDHKINSAYNRIFPIDSALGSGSTNSNYGAQLVSRIGEVELMLLSNYSISQKRTLLIEFIQVGIDLYGSLQNGADWTADGGLQSSRKSPILLTGVFLNDNGMKNVNSIMCPCNIYNGQTYLDPFQEDCQTYYDDNVSYPFYYGVLGMPRWGIRHCQADTAPNNDETNNYRLCCNSRSWIGQTLAMRLLGVESLWGHQAYFDYEDRYWKSELPFPQGGHGSYWNEAMWTTYRPTIDTCHNGVRDRCSIICNSTIVLGETGVDSGGNC